MKGKVSGVILGIAFFSIGIFIFNPSRLFSESLNSILQQHNPDSNAPDSSGQSSQRNQGGETKEFEPIEGVVHVRTSLNIRTSPWGTIIGGFHANDKVKIIGENGDWYKIEYEGGTAYVHKNYVSTSKSPAGKVPVIRSVNGSSPQGNRSGGGNNSPPPGNTQERLVSAAQALVGVRNFPYAPATKGGRLGCAQVASTALKNAGILSRVTLGVLSVMSDLKAVGWKFVQVPPFRAGDVITWSTYDRDGDGKKDPDTHIGIVMQSGNSVQAMSNSSSLRMPRINSATYAPITHVLRKV